MPPGVDDSRTPQYNGSTQLGSIAEGRRSVPSSSTSFISTSTYSSAYPTDMQSLNHNNVIYGSISSSSIASATPAGFSVSDFEQLVRPPGSIVMLIPCFLFPALGGFLFGFDIGAIASALNKGGTRIHRDCERALL